MLNWFTSRLNASAASSHPLGSDRGISACLAELSTADPQRTLEELSIWFGDPPGFIDRMPANRAARAVEELDQFAQDAVSRCWNGLLEEARNNRQIQPVGGILKDFLAGSHACNHRIVDLLAAAPERRQDRRLMARFAVRAMYSWVQLKKLAHMIGLEPTPAWWGTAHALLRQARELGIAQLALPVYPQWEEPSSVWKEYQTGAVFETAPLHNLTANQIEAADRLVRWIEPHCKFVDTHTPLTPFCIVPQGENTPARWQADNNYSEETRFFGVGQGQNQLVQLCANLAGESELPDWLAATLCNREQLLRLLQQLAANWSTTPRRRRYPRVKAQGALQVVNGLDTVWRMLAASEPAKSGRNLPAMDHWEITDISRGGMGVRLTAAHPWQRVGTLVAYRREDETDWHPAIIRRLGSSQGNPTAGLDTFFSKPRSAQTRLAENRATDTRHNAILVSAEARLLLIPAGVFSPDRCIDISIGEDWRPVRLVKLQERGTDFELVTYQEDSASS